MGKYLISSGVKQRNKPFCLSVSEVMTIVIVFHQLGSRDFKTYYIHFVCRYLTHHQVRQIGIAFVDSSKLQVYHNLRILRHQIFKGTSKRDKGMMGFGGVYTEIKVISLVHLSKNLQTRE
ncbi:hypothetical protein BTN49_1075 [Candidatus Enterovibrio escicola]|uniref:Transposase DDE domain-containing protein n=2 Tax=Candidatus Enterovibrio escicola TaxID=1927127 RepID=A0A2A5T4I7_9GAMM|nr:hypothetical protein BTN49_1075 [Candidatus Enterovibrio escacola]